MDASRGKKTRVPKGWWSPGVESYFQRRVTLPRFVPHHALFYAAGVVFLFAGFLCGAFFADPVLMVGNWFMAALLRYAGYQALILREVAARTELNNAMLAGMLERLNDPALDRYWRENAVYIEK